MGSDVEASANHEYGTVAEPVQGFLPADRSRPSASAKPSRIVFRLPRAGRPPSAVDRAVEASLEMVYRTQHHGCPDLRSPPPSRRASDGARCLAVCGRMDADTVPVLGDSTCAMMLSRTGELAALGTALCWTVSALAFEAASKRAGSLAVNIIRLAIAIVPLAAWSWFRRGVLLPWDAGWYAWGWLTASGLVGFTIGDMLLFRAFVVLGARRSMLVMSLVPPLTALFGMVFMGERLSSLDWIGMLVTLAGVVFVILERGRDVTGAVARLPVAGILLAFGGAVGQALGLVLSKKGMGAYDAFAATEIRVLAGLVGFAVLFTVIGWWSKVRAATRDIRALGSMILGAFFGPFLGVSLSLLAVQHTRSGVAATIMSLVPVTILVPSVLLRKERVSLRAAAGAVVAVGGCALLFR